MGLDRALETLSLKELVEEEMFSLRLVAGRTGLLQDAVFIIMKGKKGRIYRLSVRRGRWKHANGQILIIRISNYVLIYSNLCVFHPRITSNCSNISAYKSLQNES